VSVLGRGGSNLGPKFITGKGACTKRRVLVSVREWRFIDGLRILGRRMVFGPAGRGRKRFSYHGKHLKATGGGYRRRRRS